MDNSMKLYLIGVAVNIIIFTALKLLKYKISNVWEVIIIWSWIGTFSLIFGYLFSRFNVYEAYVGLPRKEKNTEKLLWIKVDGNVEDGMYLVKCTGVVCPAVFIMHYSLNSKGEMVWWLNSEEVWKKSLIPTHYINIETLIKIPEE